MYLRRFLICVCLAPLIYSSGFGQARPTRYGDLWSQLSQNEKYFYLSGYQDGIATFLGASLPQMAGCECREPKEAGLNRVQHTFQAVRVDLDLETVAKVMTDIYKDPANVFIMFPQMVRLAVDKLKGKDIGQDIIDNRKHVIEIHELLKKKN
jgi:hypothetical protein